MALYLFLVTVADGQGLSFYSDPTLAQFLSLDAPSLLGARQELVTAALIAYQKPLYQVLALDGPAPGAKARTPCSTPLSLGQIFHQIMEHES